MRKKSLIIKSFPQQLKIPNNFLRASYKCSATTQRMYFYSIFKYLSSKESQNSVSFTFSDFYTDLNLSDGQKTRHLIKESANEILDMKMVLEDNEQKYELINVFQSAKCVFTETTFTFKFTEDMKIFLDELKEIGFSLFEINDLGKLKSFYALRYYLIALSYRGFKGKKGNLKNSWFFDYSVEELRRVFDIQDDEYSQMGPFKNIVIELPLKELNEKNLGIQIFCTPQKKGRKIVGFHFDCIDASNLNRISESGNLFIEDNSCLKNEDGETSSKSKADLQMEAVQIIAKNPLRYAELLEEESRNPELFGLSPELNAVVRLKAELEKNTAASSSLDSGSAL